MRPDLGVANMRARIAREYEGGMLYTMEKSRATELVSELERAWVFVEREFARGFRAPFVVHARAGMDDTIRESYVVRCGEERLVWSGCDLFYLSKEDMFYLMCGEFVAALHG
jgi:hypothetical protein